MNDEQIIDLYWTRSENAISETEKKYGKYCKSISYNILKNHEDSEECVYDAYLKVWQSIPPKKPPVFSAFLAKITRNISLNKYKQKYAAKRGNGQVEIVLEELSDILSSRDTVEQYIDEHILIDALNNFLKKLPSRTRVIFLQRYWYLNSINEISKRHKLSESNIKMILLRTRNELKNYLNKEGIWI